MRKKIVYSFISAAAALALSLAVSCIPAGRFSVRAEEAGGYYDEWGNWISEGDASADTGLAVSEDIAAAESESTTLPTGTYSVGAGWSADSTASTEDVTVYEQDAHLGEQNTSTISCSYLDTNYSVFEYEQLREMLTNQLYYNNVNAQISTSAGYTSVKDYLYIVIVDDTAQDYTDIYYYVVGNYRCFCTEVREYRSEAEEASAQGLSTPREMGQSISEGFVWNG